MLGFLSPASAAPLTTRERRVSGHESLGDHGGDATQTRNSRKCQCVWRNNVREFHHLSSLSHRCHLPCWCEMRQGSGSECRPAAAVTAVVHRTDVEAKLNEDWAKHNEVNRKDLQYMILLGTHRLRSRSSRANRARSTASSLPFLSPGRNIPNRWTLNLMD